MISVQEQTPLWSSLRKAWHGYKVALDQKEHDEQLRYAYLIQEICVQLGLEIPYFACLDE